MAKNIIITPSPTTEPIINFAGNSGGNISLKVMDDGTVAFVGNSGTLFTINDSLVGKLQGVYNISGLPIFEVYSDPSVIVYGPLQVNTSVYTNGLYLNSSNNDLNTGYSLYYDPSSKKVTYGLNGYVTFLSTGCVTVPTISYTSSQITLGSCKARLYPSNDYSGILKEYDIAGDTFNFSQNTEYCIAVHYNNGTPIYKLFTTLDEISESDKTPVITFYHDGLSLHSVKWYDLGLGKVDKMHQRLIRTARFKREGPGMRISVDNYQHVKITNGIVWCGVNRITIPSFDSSINKMHYYSKTSGNWGFTMTNLLNNNKYNNGSNLVSLDSDKFAVNWIYNCAENDNDVYILPGEGNYTLNDAISAQEPIDIPLHIKYHAVLTGKVIYLCNATVPMQVQSISDVALTSGGAIADHNTLNNLQGGTINQFYHLTQPEYSRVQLLDASFNSKAPINNPIFTGTVTVPSNISYNMYGSSRTPFLIYGGNATGQGLAISGQGTTIIGGGSSPNTAAANISSNESSTYITGDSTVTILTNLSAGWGGRREYIFGKDGTLNVPGLLINNKSVLSGNIGSNGQILFNDNGSISAGFNYDKNTNEISCNGIKLNTNSANIILGSGAVKNLTTYSPGGITVTGWRAAENLTSFNRVTSYGYMSLGGATSAAYGLALGFAAGRNETNADYKLIIESNDSYNNTNEYLIEGNFHQRWVKFNGALKRNLFNKKNLASSSLFGSVTATYAAYKDIDINIDMSTMTYDDILVVKSGNNEGFISSIVAIYPSLKKLSLAKTPATSFTIGDNMQIVKGYQILNKNMNSDYYINLDDDDYAIKLPIVAAEYNGAEFNIIISSNNNNKSLYVVPYSSSRCIIPHNTDNMIITEPYTIYKFKQFDNNWIYTKEKIHNLIPIINSTKDININIIDSIYKLNISSNSIITLNMDSMYSNMLKNNALTIELHINMTSVSTITWPTNVTWVSNKAPTFSAIDNYVLVFRTIDAGANWIGNLAYSVNNTAQPSTLVANQLNIRENKAESYNSEFNLLFIPPRDISGNSSVYFTKTVNDDKLTYDSSNGILNSKKFKGDGSLLTNINISNNMISEYISSGFDGVNKQVILQNNYSNIQVYLNGLRQFLNDDYTTSSGKYITFIVAPKNGDKVICDYIKI